MKTNIKALELVNHGLSVNFVGGLTEGQINTLHKKMIQEQSTVTSTKTVYDSKDPKQIAALNQMLKTPDSLKNKNVEVKEGKGKKKNPFAICTATMGKEFGTTERSEWSDKQMKKYEKCVQDIKKTLKEGKEPVSLFLENKIMELIQTHIPPRITKKDLLNHINESSPDVAPAEPKTKPKPGTKDKPSPTKKPTHPLRPGKQPLPGPKASSKNEEFNESQSASAPAEPKTKPKPGTKDKPSPTKKPTHPLRPGKQPLPGPKATKINPNDAKDEIINTIMQILNK